MTEKVNQDFSLNTKNRMYMYVLFFIQSILISRWLGPDGEGIYGRINGSYQVLVLVIEMGVSGALLHYLASGQISLEKAKKRSLTFLVLAAFLCTTLGIISISFPFLNFLFPNYTATSFLVFYLFVSTWIEVARLLTLSFFHSQTQFNFPNKIERWTGILRLFLFSVALLFFTGSTPQKVQVILSLLLGANSFMLLIFYIGLWKKSKSFAVLAPANINRSFTMEQFSILVYLGNLLAILTSRIYLWVVEYVQNLRAVGLFVVANKPCQILFFFPYVLSMTLTAHLSQQKLSPEKFARISRVNLQLLTFLGIGLVLMAPLIVSFLFGKAFSESLGPMRFLVIAAVINGFRSLFSLRISLDGGIKRRIAADFIQFISALSLSYFWGKYYGLTGVAVADLVASLIGLIVLLMFAKVTMKDFLECSIPKRADFSWLIKRNFNELF